jgi:single-strand DNA-binding protein
MKGLNRVSLIGHLGKDPDLVLINESTRVAKVSMATSESYRNKEGDIKTQTDWHSLVIWGKLADLASAHLRKGTKLFVEGKLKTRKYEDKQGATKYVSEVIVDKIVII